MFNLSCSFLQNVSSLRSFKQGKQAWWIEPKTDFLVTFIDGLWKYPSLGQEFFTRNWVRATNAWLLFCTINCCTQSTSATQYSYRIQRQHTSRLFFVNLQKSGRTVQGWERAGKHYKSKAEMPRQSEMPTVPKTYFLTLWSTLQPDRREMDLPIEEMVSINSFERLPRDTATRGIHNILTERQSWRLFDSFL